MEFQVRREILIRAGVETVWRYFEDNARFARWWGQGSTIDGRQGGAIKIVYPDGSTASGEILEWIPRERIVFSFGYDDPAKPIAPGASRVQIDLTEDVRGTHLALRHDVADEATRDMHVPGWRYSLAVFSKLACEDQHQAASATVERWFAAWNEGDDALRAQLLHECAADDVEFADGFGVTRGVDDLNQHIAMARMHAPHPIEADGTLRQTQGTVLCDWIVRGPDHEPLMRGTNVCEMAPDGRFARVVGVAAV